MVSREEFGRDFFANVCRHYKVYVSDDVKDLWEEHGRWFTKRSECATACCQRLRKLFFSNSSPGANSRVENKKAGQNFYRSDLLKLLVAGTGFEPMTFGL